MNGYIAERMFGRKIKNFSPEENGDCIVFEFYDGKPLTLVAVGDCCSHTWIESMDNPECLVGGVVNSVENIDMPNLGDVPGKRIKEQFVESVEYYGLRITTDKGICVLDYRNDSNGYYGGSLEVSE